MVESHGCTSSVFSHMEQAVVLTVTSFNTVGKGCV